MTSDQSSAAGGWWHQLRDWPLEQHGHRLRTVVCLDRDVGGWHLRRRGPRSERHQGVRLGKRSSVQDLDVTFFALLYLLRLQLPHHLFKPAGKKQTEKFTNGCGQTVYFVISIKCHIWTQPKPGIALIRAGSGVRMQKSSVVSVPPAGSCPSLELWRSYQQDKRISRLAWSSLWRGGGTQAHMRLSWRAEGIQVCSDSHISPGPQQ